MTPSAARPSLDPRYALGLCAHCSRFPKPVGAPRPAGLDEAKVVQLVAASSWDPTLIPERRRLSHERRVIRNPRDKAEQAEATEIRRRWAAEAAERRSAR